jgi:hypothetical protein
MPHIVGMGGVAVLLLAYSVATISARPARQAKEGTSPAPPQVSGPPVTVLYQDANPYVEWSTEQLIKAVPKLKGLEPATSQDSLPTILKKTGENVDSFFQNFVNATARERIYQTASVPSGRWMNVRDSHHQDGYYVVLKSSRGGQDRFDEYRMNLKGRPVESAGSKHGFLLTRGFAGDEIYLHPSRQPESTFRYLGRQSNAGQQCEVIAFAQRVGQAIPIEFITGGVSVPMLEQGIVWIDCVSHQIVDMQTDLLTPLAQIGLMRSTREIEYAPVHFATLDQTFWLPTEVQVVVSFRGATYTNQHRYSDWKVFKVDTEQTIKGSGLDSQNPNDKR